MKNKFLKLLSIIFSLVLIFSNVYAQQVFNFDVSEIQIKENGNKFYGNKRGTVSSTDKILITSDRFEYNKITNVLSLFGNIFIEDNQNKIKIFAERIDYYKNDEIIITGGKTDILVDKKYDIKSNNIKIDRNRQEISSIEETTLLDQFQNKYHSDTFNYNFKKELLKATNINYTSNLDTFFFKDGFFDLKNQNFNTSDIIIKFNKNTFGNYKNDPRIYAISSTKKGNLTELNKASFTSCSQNDSCPPWVLTAEKIIHDKNKKQIIYDNALLKIYDIPVFYFPKFFHPDPTVKRQSGFLMPFFNNSNNLGSSIQIPYYAVISNNIDLTFKPTIFNEKLKIYQAEYRYKGKNSSLIADVAHTRDYQSSEINKNKNINHLFSNYNMNLQFENFDNSSLEIKLEKSNNDNYLKLFEQNLNNSSLFPNQTNLLTSEIKIELGKDNSNLVAGMSSFETLDGKSSDRYQYILPYYNFVTDFYNIFESGYIDFNSKGENNLKNTNNLRTRIINDVNYNGYDLITNNGFVNNVNFYFKNLNTMAKNDEIYKSTPQIQLMNILEFNSTFPLIKNQELFVESLIPKLSLRYNPGKMKNYSNEKRNLFYDNLFQINRLGIEDSFEAGRSITLGLEYKKENLKMINDYFKFNIGTVLRDKVENDIPKTSTINTKYGNVLGNISRNWSDEFILNYDFSINNDLKQIQYNSINTKFNKNNIFAEINYIKEKDIIGNEHILENTLGYTINENSILKYNSRVNKKINLTEFNDIIYEYKNDCLTASVKYRKTFYSDRDLKPSEDFMFTISLFPLTTFEQRVGN